MTTGSQVSRQIECNLLLADAIAKQNHLPEAFALIETCLALAEPEGYLRVFLDVGKPAEELVSAYLKER